MTRAFEQILEGLQEAVVIAEGSADPATFRAHVPEVIDVRAIRAAQGLSQEAFARRYGFSTPAVRDWEQGRRRPEAAARVLLKVIEKRPDAVLDALSR